MDSDNAEKPDFNLHRGYYSETVGKPRPETGRLKEPYPVCKRAKLTWQVKTERYAPVIPKRTISPLRKRHLLPAERWITLNEELQLAFPVDAFTPKVQALYEVEPGKLPRKVLVERKRRKFATYDIKNLLNEAEIHPIDLIPPEVLEWVFTPEEQFSVINPLHFLPLELFDNADFDCRNPQEWLDLGLIGDVSFPVPAEAFLPKTMQTMESLRRKTNTKPINECFDWFNVAVTEYDEEKNLWTVFTLDVTEAIYKIPRIYLMFKAEDPLLYVERVKDAVTSRDDAETNIRFQFYLDCMCVSGLPELSQETYTRVLNSALRDGSLTVVLKKGSTAFQDIEVEVKYLHQKVYGEMVFRYMVRRHRDMFSYVKIPDLPEMKVPEKGCISTDMEDFAGVRNYMSWINLYVLPEAYHSICHVVESCRIAGSMCFFTEDHRKQLSLEWFHAVQTEHLQKVMEFLRVTWLKTMTDSINKCLSGVGKGWYNIYENKWEIYSISKLSRLMELIRFLMQSTLRQIVENSLEMYVKLVEEPCLCLLDCPDDFVWGEDIYNTQFEPDALPLFNLVVNMDESEPSYTPVVKDYEKTLVDIFDNAVYESHFIQQVHPHVLVNLRFPEDLNLSSVGLIEPFVCAFRERVAIAYRKAVIPIFAYLKEYIRFQDLWKLDVEKYASKYREETHTSDEVLGELIRYNNNREEFQKTIPDKILIGPFEVNAASVRRTLVNKSKQLFTMVRETFCSHQRDEVELILTEYKNIFRKMKDKITSIERLLEFRDWTETIPFQLKGLEASAMKVKEGYDKLSDTFLYALPDGDFYALFEVLIWPRNIYELLEKSVDFFKDEFVRLKRQQKMDEIDFANKVVELQQAVEKTYEFDDYSKIHEYAVEVNRIWKEMKEHQEFGHVLNKRQKIFGSPVTPFEDLSRLIKEFEPRKSLWITASDWLHSREIWLDNPLTNIDGDGMERSVLEMYRTVNRLMKQFSGEKAAYELAEQVKNEIEEFRPMIPLIQGLRSPGMKQRHWNQVFDQTGVRVEPSPFLTFNNCLSLNVQDHIEVITQIAETASKEYSIQQTLEKMQKEWEGMEMEVAPYKETGTYIMKIADEVTSMLDDHISITQQISFSPFKAALEAEISDWETRLYLTKKVLEVWMELQKTWMYLEPIFASPDINRQLPVEGKRYSSMERTWRRIMKSALEQPKVIVICPDKRLYESLKDCVQQLEVVQKGLAAYLETKRTKFPRFYFLSDEELLEILAQSRNPLAVQPHLKKCFENINKLDFEEKDLHIIAMYSAEGERVVMIPDMYPTGNVEDWLLEVEANMRNTIRVTLMDALEDIMIKERNAWVLVWPGQIVIAGSQTFWTAGVEKGIREHALGDFFQVMLDMLDGLRTLVKGQLKRVERQVLSALIVIEVHARDVTQKLVDQGVDTINDFDWISQLRYYSIDEQLKIRAVNAEFPYGYEYLGNSGRLVITPLTDRCYLTLTGALHLKFGGAPAGPAGTGKTETTKDLGKAFAIQCVVFNCSDQLDFMAMGKFFKGLASSGAWACFDEFNRIDIEVLSVVAQQITTIQKAQQARLDRFLFEGADIALKESCAVFITMNPGYAGRTELPDNLKALFRPVAMMVPNYALIAEISLFSFGFSNAKDLAGKITTTFKLSSEQLSSQDHYDFGMRAVKTVIAVAGNLKRERPTMNEKQIVLRALRDVNVPKFLRDDLKLFNGIVSDLFPRMIEETIDYGVLEKSISNACRKQRLEDVPEFVRKVIQLYETTVVRHGLMLVGPTGSGKTKCYEVLQGAMTALQGEMSPAGSPFEEVFTYVVNPKSITMGQLYGEYDLLTHEWTDGILSSLVRLGAAATDLCKRWYVFDGPVDAVWIENMNTVLDDNKKLCLSSGEIIKLQETMTMMFEVADLAVASPATVSRCGMVYLEPSVLGLEPFINCWLQRQPQQMAKFEKQLRELMSHYLLPSLVFLRAKMKEIVGSVDSALVMSFFNLMDIRILPLTQPDGKPLPQPMFMDLIPDLIVPWVLFSVIWSVGATCHADSRELFSEWFRKRMEDGGHEPKFPPGLVYDYRLHDGGFSNHSTESDVTKPGWVNWMVGVDAYVIGVDTKFSDIEVPTIDNVRNADILGQLVSTEHQVLCIGPTGTCKTVTISSKLSRGMHKKFICDFISFSARTTANQTQDLIDSKLDKRRRNTFGPPAMKKQVFFIDDLNMPALEVYGAQPPIELLRQWMDFRGWYDRKNVGEFRNIIDVIFVGAMGPPGGGRNPVTMRLLRHFHYLSFTDLSESSQRQIFGTILKSWMDRAPRISGLLNPLVTATLEVYSTILRELLPTPAKTHYTFNLRDLSKVFQGVLMLDPESVENIGEVLRLWYHECCRVFQDRLVNDADRSWFDELLRTKIRQDFQCNPDAVLGDGVILYGDFIDPNAGVRLYQSITDMQKLSEVLDKYLDDYNSMSTAPMKLVMFLDAICHVCRISRIIRQPLGNALLLGMGGSGRQSLTRLAAHMAEYVCFQIELSKSYGMNEWRDDIKQLMMNAGARNVETVFLFSDTQIKSESFLEDLNNVLNSGDVPNIYQIEELDIIYQAVKGDVQEQGLDLTRSNLFSAYLKNVRSNMHEVITMSPIGEVFRARLRQFPALVNCCTIDWFSAWPDAALQSVAYQFLEDIPDLAVTKEVLEGIVVMCQFMHQSVVDISVLFLEELSRHNYVTPTSYLELLSSYSVLLNKKKKELVNNRQRLSTGLDKLLNTAEEVKVLQIELADMQPALKQATEQTSIMLVKIAADRQVAEDTKAVVEKEEAQAVIKAEETQAIADDAQRDLDEAMPALMAAEASLKALNKGDISEVRAFKSPPMGVQLVMEAMCIVKNVKPKKIPGTMPGEKILDYWEPGRGLLANPDHFLSSLMNFDKESITEEMQKSLKPYIENPAFQPAKILSVSKACTSLCMWVHAIYKYYFVNKAVAPKKAALAEAKAELAITEAILAEAKAKMQEVLDGLAILEAKLKETEDRKAELEANMKLCEDRMDRAVRLVTGLADERLRWLVTIDQIGISITKVVGDILISAGAIAYLTPFTDQYRRNLLTQWLDLLEKKKVPHTPKCNPVSIMGEPVQIRGWQLNGLPRDALSVENAVLVMNSQRWPLFIDPQGQANRWVRNEGKKLGLAVAKMSDRDLIRTLESAVRFGKACLIENVGVEIDPGLDSILMRQVFRQGGINMIKVGDNIIPYNDDFRLFLTTRLPNPHYTPEVSIKVLLVNFALVPSGLTDQLLALVVMEERPDLEAARGALIVNNAEMRRELKEIEDLILHKLSASEGSPVDDIELIDTLEASKIKSEEIKVKVADAEKTQIDIDATRAEYIPVANRGQILFFCLVDLANIDPMYQYSLEWFTHIFIYSMANAEKTDLIDVRVTNINESFTFNLYSNVCRSLFEKHKLHFAFLLCARIQMDEGIIEFHEWHHLLAGGSPPKIEPNPAPEWLSIKSWTEILAMSVLPNFTDLVDSFAKNLRYYQAIFDAVEPNKKPLPQPWEEKLDDFQRLLILKALRPDKVTNAMQDYLSIHLGPQFIEPQTTDLAVIFKESSPTTPLVFVLSTGTDPAADLYKFADKMKFSKRMHVISLGQGQGPLAELMMNSAMEMGYWVFFQNCHLSPSWMPRLDYLVENINPDTTHRDFRMWLTSTPSPAFPVSILQNCCKMTVEPPRGLKANMMRAYANQVTEFQDFFHSDHPKVYTFKWLLFSLCLFHGVCLERRKFGPLGFNIPYEFTDGDLRICISQLHMFLLEYDEVPFKVLIYTAGQINYGGRVTDDWDRRFIMNMLSDYYNIEIINADYQFDEDGIYHQLPGETPLTEYMTYVKTFPLNDDPCLFGLHSNADITYAQRETYSCLATLLALQPKVVGGQAQSQEDVTSQQANEILREVPLPLDVEEISAKYPVLYEESLNTVLVQEVIRYNRLLGVIHSSLKELLKAIKGLVVMSEALESMARSLFTNLVPVLWSSKAYPSLKPLGAWVKDLIERISFLNEWIDKGIPAVFWISGFYFPQAFLTGTLQNFARKYIISIDTIDFGFKVLDAPPKERPDDGCCIYGLFLEGARWSPESGVLSESKPKELYTDMAVVWLLPEQNRVPPEKGIYECPVYKTLTRAGTLSTTGHSTNYVVAIEIPSSKPQTHWIKRGVALICALDY